MSRRYDPDKRFKAELAKAKAAARNMPPKTWGGSLLDHSKSHTAMRWVQNKDGSYSLVAEDVPSPDTTSEGDKP
jgi:hypothetical protein